MDPEQAFKNSDNAQPHNNDRRTRIYQTPNVPKRTQLVHLHTALIRTPSWNARRPRYQSARAVLEAEQPPI